MSRGLGLDHVEHRLLFHPSILEDPPAVEAMTREAKDLARRKHSPAALVEWDEPVVGPVAVPRNLVDGDTPTDTTPVQMAQVHVTGRLA